MIPFPRQFFASLVIGLFILIVIIRLVQRGKLDIAYCWVWLGIGAGILLTVLRYDWLVDFSALIGAVTPTTTLFLLGFVVVLLMCLQFSLVISQQRRQIRRLAQNIALLERPASPPQPADQHREPPAP